MSLPLIIRDDAEADIAEAMAWYNRQRSGLGDQFLQSFEAALQRIERAPLAAAEEFRGARRVLLRRFPYSVIYRPGSDHIAILAVYHTSRDPRGWQARV
jgi:plasmid stabilization system protein ParE